jgi:hypothetical protein
MSFHEGEIAVQERTGLRAEGAKLERAVHDALTPGAARFLGDAETLAVSALAPDGRLWASVWGGRRGFVHASDDLRRVSIDRSRLAIARDDPVAANLEAGGRIGLLAIDLSTRRRIRINGTVTSRVAGEWVVRVDEAFGNCAMYIQRRHATPAGETLGEGAGSSRGDRLDADARALIARADTAFVASLHPDRGLDVSHRGGPSGFIVVESDRTLLVPDYPGNNMFTTLGNFAVSPRAGLAVVDFEHARCLTMTGEAVVVHGLGDAEATSGTKRFWRLTVESWMAFDLDRRVRWTLVDSSPFNPRRVMRAAGEER